MSNETIRDANVARGMWGIAAALAVAFTASEAHAATCTWQSTSSSAWSVAANWSCGHVPAQADDVVFPGGANLQFAVNNDFAPFAAVHALSVTGGAYTFTGSTLYVTAGISSSAASGPLFQLPISLAASQAFTNLGPGPLVFQTGAISLIGFDLTLAGSADISLYGPISGNGSLTKTSSALVLLAGTNAFTGPVVASAGTLRVQSPLALGPANGSTTIKGSAKLELATGVTVAVEPLVLATSASPAVENVSGSGAWNGTIVLQSAATLKNSSPMPFSIGGMISGGFAITTTGNGMILSGPNAHTGGTTIANGGSGLILANAQGLGTGAVTVQDGGALSVNVTGTISNPIALVGPGTGTVYTLETNGMGPPTVFAGTIDLGALVAIETTPSTTTEFGGGVTGGMLVKRGAGTLRITSPATYGANTLVVQGTLASGVMNAFPASTVITASSGTTVAFGAYTQGLEGIAGSGTFSTDATLTVGGGTDTTLDGTLSGSGSLILVTGGTTTLSGMVSLAGPIAVKAGALDLAGATVTQATLDVGAGATLDVGANTALSHGITVESGGTLDVAKLTPRTGTSGDVLLGAGTTLRVACEGSTPGECASWSVIGSVTLGGALDATVSFVPNVGDSLVLVANDGSEPVLGTFAGLAEGATTTISGRLFAISYAGGTGNDVVLTAVAIDADAGVPADGGAIDTDAGTVEADAGVPGDAGSDGSTNGFDGGATTPPTTSGGCSVTPLRTSSSSSWAVAGAMIASLAMLRRRRARREG